MLSIDHMVGACRLALRNIQIVQNTQTIQNTQTSYIKRLLHLLRKDGHNVKIIAVSRRQNCSFMRNTQWISIPK